MMSGPQKSFMCENGHVIRDTQGQRPHGKLSLCRCCEAENVLVFDLQRAHAKAGLTDLQYSGGPHMTTNDHLCLFRMIGEVFGHLPPPSVPQEANGEWGFKQWANEITHGRW